MLNKKTVMAFLVAATSPLAAMQQMLEDWKSLPVQTIAIPKQLMLNPVQKPCDCIYTITEGFDLIGNSFTQYYCRRCNICKKADKEIAFDTRTWQTTAKHYMPAQPLVKFTTCWSNQPHVYTDLDLPANGQYSQSLNIIDDQLHCEYIIIFSHKKDTFVIPNSKLVAGNKNMFVCYTQDKQTIAQDKSSGCLSLYSLRLPIKNGDKSTIVCIKRLEKVKELDLTSSYLFMHPHGKHIVFGDQNFMHIYRPDYAQQQITQKLHKTLYSGAFSDVLFTQ